MPQQQLRTQDFTSKSSLHSHQKPASPVRRGVLSTSSTIIHLHSALNQNEPCHTRCQSFSQTMRERTRLLPCLAVLVAATAEADCEVVVAELAGVCWAVRPRALGATVTCLLCWLLLSGGCWPWRRPNVFCKTVHSRYTSLEKVKARHQLNRNHHNKCVSDQNPRASTLTASQRFHQIATNCCNPTRVVYPKRAEAVARNERTDTTGRQTDPACSRGQVCVLHVIGQLRTHQRAVLHACRKVSVGRQVINRNTTSSQREKETVVVLWHTHTHK